MNINKSLMLTAALVAASAAPGIASASTVLDTGTPTSSANPMVLDQNDYYAAEFNLTAGQTVTGIQAYLVNAGMDQPGDTFTVALYGSDLLTSRSPTQLVSGQVTYEQDGWTGLSGLSFTAPTTGTYWAALEVGPNDSAIGLGLPSTLSGGTAPALDFAINTGSGSYSDQGAMPFGVQVTVADAAPVPLPPAVWLFGSGVLGFGALARRRRLAIVVV